MGDGTVWYCRLMRKGAWVLALALAFAANAHAQLPRQFPAGAKLGELTGQQQPFPLLQIGDKVLRLAPGGRIIDENNRIILHVYLPKQAHVLYLEDASGEVSRVFILRPDELEQVQRTAR
jgi:hypothetical protein